MALAVEQDVSPDPADVRLLRLPAVVPEPERFTDGVEQARLAGHQTFADAPATGGTIVPRCVVPGRTHVRRTIRRRSSRKQRLRQESFRAISLACKDRFP